MKVPRACSPFTFSSDGAAHHPGAATALLPELDRLTASQPQHRAGTRAAVARCGTHACLAERGDIWAYATPILHASAAASGDRRRRVLQVDYAAYPLEPLLEWLGV